MNCKAIHLSNRILSNSRKVTHHREIDRINLVISFNIEQECYDSVIQENIHI